MSDAEGVTLVEDMTFADTSESTVQPLSVRITNIDLGQVNVVYERTIVDNAGSGGFVYDVEEVGHDTFDEETVYEMIADGTWLFVSAPMQEPTSGDDA